MQPSDIHNPYAPPKADVAGPLLAASGAPYRAPINIEEALRLLREHVADPRNVQVDRAAAGARVRPIGSVLAGLGVVFGVVGGVLSMGPDQEALMIAGIAIGGVLALLGVLLIGVDLSLAARDKPSTPDKALRSFLKSITMGRYGYAWSSLCPTARDQTVRTPDLTPVKTALGVFPLRGEADLKAYVQGFVRSSGAVMRVMGIKMKSPPVLEGDVARVSVELRFQSWPRWVSILTAVGFILFRPLFIPGAIAFFVTRKRKNVFVTKTMLRAQNGVWYVYDGDLLEGASA